MLQSNVIAVLDAHPEQESACAEWLEASLRPFWAASRETFRFAGSIIFARKHPAPLGSE